MSSGDQGVIRVAMLEDDSSYIDTMRLVIETDPQLVFVAAFRNPVRFLNAVADLDVDVLLLDINLPKITGIECIRSFKELKPAARVVMLTVEIRRESVLEAFVNGADGYLLKDASPEQIGDGIREACDDGVPMSPSIARLVVGMLKRIESEKLKRLPNSDAVNQLTSREREVLTILADGLKYAEIASRMEVSLDTVKSHVRSIYKKLGARNRAEAVNHLLR